MFGTVAFVMLVFTMTVMFAVLTAMFTVSPVLMAVMTEVLVVVFMSFVAMVRCVVFEQIMVSTFFEKASVTVSLPVLSSLQNGCILERQQQ